MNAIHGISSELSCGVAFSLAGRTCVLRSDSAELRELIRPLVRSDLPSGFTLHVKVDSALQEHTPGRAHFRGLHHLAFALFGDELFVFDMLRSEVHAAVSLRTAGHREFWVNTLFPIALGTLGTTFGVVPLHCACLERGGEALLLAGPSGAGKSTLAVALAKTGFNIVSDDWTYLCQDASELVAHGLDAPVKLLPDAIQYFPELESQSARQSLNGELAYEVSAEVFGAGTRRDSRPSVVLLMRRVEAPGVELRECSPDLVRDYFERSAERLPREMVEAAGTRARVIRSVAELACYSVECGGAPHEVAASISDWWRAKR